MKLELEAGLHYLQAANVAESAAIVDARAYYKAFYRAALRAKRYLLIAGWQFDTEVPLLRGDDARDAPLPVRFLPFLEALCQREPELRIYVLAWDFSLVYALEREWLQSIKFALSTPSAVRFEYDRHPQYNASHHQKFVVIDSRLAFVGGMDICDERWDDRGHVPDDPLRVNVAGQLCRPNHEVQSGVVGEAAGLLAEIFCARWRDACGEELSLPSLMRSASFDLRELTDGAALPLRAREVAVSRTALQRDGSVIPEIRLSYEAAIAAAERLIYIETQYFTSRSMAAALVARLRAKDKPKLQIIVVLPKGADNSKEKFALGEVQSMVLGVLEQVAAATGHELRLFCSAVATDEGSGTTFIHSKVLVIDDEFLSIGSANMTERSMGLDTELALFWQARANPELTADIARVRASLLSEHSGKDPQELTEIDGLTQRIDSWISEHSARLLRCHFQPRAASELKTQIFDPGAPATLPLEHAASGWDGDRERLTSGNSLLQRELERRSEPSSRAAYTSAGQATKESAKKS